MRNHCLAARFHEMGMSLLSSPRVLLADSAFNWLMAMKIQILTAEDVQADDLAYYLDLEDRAEARGETAGFPFKLYHLP